MREGAGVAQATSLVLFPMTTQGCLVLNVRHLVLVVVTLEVFVIADALLIRLVAFTVPVLVAI